MQVCLFAFDLIYLNGRSLIKEPLIKRRDLLREHFQPVEGEFVFANSVDTDSMEEVQEFLEESVKGIKNIVQCRDVVLDTPITFLFNFNR